MHAVSLVRWCSRAGAFATVIVVAAVPLAAQAAATSCMATTVSMTPSGWPAARTGGTARSISRSGEGAPFKAVADIPLPGAAKRFDYQSLDTTTGRLYISHMRGDRLDVFDTRSGKLLRSIEGFPGSTGVLSVPALHHVYVSVTGRHEVAVVDDRSLVVVAFRTGRRVP